MFNFCAEKKHPGAPPPAPSNNVENTIWHNRKVIPTLDEGVGGGGGKKAGKNEKKLNFWGCVKDFCP